MVVIAIIYFCFSIISSIHIQLKEVLVILKLQSISLEKKVFLYTDNQDERWYKYVRIRISRQYENCRLF